MASSRFRRNPLAGPSTSSGHASPARSTRTAPKYEEDRTSTYDIGEERITDVLSRKLEQLREEKDQIENALEIDTEPNGDELSSYRRTQQGTESPEDDFDFIRRKAASSSSHSGGVDVQSHGVNTGGEVRFLPADVMLDAMRRENEALRTRLFDTEKEYIRVTRLNDTYREELIEHRRRLGLPLDSLVGLPTNSPVEMTHRPTNAMPLLVRGLSSHANASSPAVSAAPITSIGPRYSHPITITAAFAVPIPRLPSVPHHRSVVTSASTSTNSSGFNSPMTTSPSSIPSSPYPFSSPQPINSSSYTTQATTPPSSASPLAPLPNFALPIFGLTYPSVPPPSLSSSLGSPVMMFAPRPGSSGVSSPVNEARSRHGSFQAGPSRRLSIERRLAESGAFMRSRRGSSVMGVHEFALDSISDSGS